jgi:diguanylate cyclase (GGDEF)-like protein
MIALVRRWLKLLFDVRAPSAAHAVEPAAQPPGALAAAVQAETSVLDSLTAVELIVRLTELTTSVARDVKQHSGHIESITTELSGVPDGDVAAVSALVCKLVVLNQQMQRRLEQAETKLQSHQRQIQEVSAAARTDSLTGLVNRRGLDEELRRCLESYRGKQRPQAILLLDVDHFKSFNDTHGHLAGDRALVHLADVLRSQARQSEIVARYGGEEFAIVFRDTSAAAIRQRVERIRQAIGSTAFHFEDRKLRITASAGLASLLPGEDEQAWLKRADSALYAAKLDGRNSSFWHDGERSHRIEADTCESGDGRPRSPAIDLAPEAFADATFLAQVSRRIAEWRRGGTTVSVILARIDHLARHIEQHGSEARQAVFKVVLQFARASLRDMDLLTRWTADGLAILLPGARVADAAGVARRIGQAIERYDLPLGEQVLKLSVCAGVAEVIENNDASRLLERAWLAVDAARQAGEGSIFQHDGLHSVPLASAAVAAG